MRPALILFITITGCADVANSLFHPARSAPAAAAVDDKSAGCSEFHGNALYWEQKPAHWQVPFLVCAAGEHSKITGAEKLHARYDDRRMRQLPAAIILVAAATHDDGHDHAWTGVLGWYAEHVDREVLRGELVGIAPAVQTDFIALVDKARTSVLGREREFSADDRRLAAAADHVRERRRAYFAKWATIYDQLDPLDDRVAKLIETPHPDPELESAISSLRVEYLAKCRAESCEDDPLFTQLSYDLMWLASFRGDRLTALIEEGALQPATSYAAALRAKPDEEMLELQHPDLPPQSSRVVNGIVEAVTDDKGTTKITFRPHAVDVEEVTDRSVNVYVPGETPGRGTIQKATVEVSLGTHKGTDREKPVFVPAGDARALRSGEQVRIMINGDHREGRVIVARRNRTLVQIRGLRIEPAVAAH